MNNMPETTNQNRVLFIEWIPQIMHNVHQTGPAGQIIFIPPSRDPFNYNFDPLVPIGVEAVGTAMHARLVAKGMAGSAMRSAAPYSHLVERRHAHRHLLPQSDRPPHRNHRWTDADHCAVDGRQAAPHRRLAHAHRAATVALPQSIDYMIEVERVMDYGFLNRETLLYNMYVMGKRAIDRGNKDSWTITPKRIAALKAAGAAEASATSGPAGPNYGTSSDADMVVGRDNSPPLSAALYTKVLQDPAYRDARGYIITADQDDFPDRG